MPYLMWGVPGPSGDPGNRGEATFEGTTNAVNACLNQSIFAVSSLFQQQILRKNIQEKITLLDTTINLNPPMASFAVVYLGGIQVDQFGSNL